MTPDFHAHAKQRLISNAYPGWWVRTYRWGSSEEDWLKVTAVRNFEPKTPGDRRVTQLVCVVDEETREGAEVTDFSNELILCCTKAEAKKAGVA